MLEKVVHKTSLNCPVISNEEVAQGVYLMQLHAPQIAATAQPGQFVNVDTHPQPNHDLTPLLRRPFSVCQINRDEESISILWKIVGPGTRLLAAHKPGTVINLIGPLGKGYKLPEKDCTVALVAGGLGVAPLPILANALYTQSIHFDVMLGIRSKEELWGIEALENSGGTIQVATDDGSAGHHGFVTDLLSQWINQHKELDRNKLRVYSCGPMPMLEKIAMICQRDIVEAQVAIETIMGCGFGICMGCPVEPAAGLEKTGRYYLTCMDGPVFNSNEIRYESIID